MIQLWCLVESRAHCSVKPIFSLSGEAHNYSVYAPHSVYNFSKSPLFKYDIRMYGDCKLTISQTTEFHIYSDPRIDAVCVKLMGKKSLHEAGYEALHIRSLFWKKIWNRKEWFIFTKKVLSYSPFSLGIFAICSLCLHGKWHL